MLFRPTAVPSSYVTVSLLGYAGLRAKNWAFWQMAPAPPRLARASGVTFSKLLGCGAGNGFSLKPDFGTYVWVACWKERAAADRFFARHRWWRTVRETGSEQLVFRLRPTMAHGSWNGRAPFEAVGTYAPERPVAVLTRATVRPLKIKEFRDWVPAASAEVTRAPGRILSLGIGEYPLIMQATFSLWRSGREMTDFAYGSQLHRDIVARTRRRKWYGEDLFARLSVEEIDGNWNGRSGDAWWSVLHD